MKSLIVAMDMELGIGKDNDLMWRLPADMKFFKETTMGHVVVMGRKSYDSIPEKFRPLPGRENVILTRNVDYKAEGCKVFNSLEECFENYKDDERTIFIIGGGEIYKQAMDQVDEMFITHVFETFKADTFFPDLSGDWEVEEIANQYMDEKHKHSFIIRKYKRK